MAGPDDTPPNFLKLFHNICSAGKVCETSQQQLGDLEFLCKWGSQVTRVWFNVAERRERLGEGEILIVETLTVVTVNTLSTDCLLIFCVCRVSWELLRLLIPYWRQLFIYRPTHYFPITFPASDEVWLYLFIDMKRSGSENNLVGKEQNLSQEFWPTIKIKFPVAWVCLRLPHTETSVSQARTAFLFHFNLLTIFSLSSAYLDWYEEGCKSKSIVWLI